MYDLNKIADEFITAMHRFDRKCITLFTINMTTNHPNCASITEYVMNFPEIWRKTVWQEDVVNFGSMVSYAFSWSDTTGTNVDYWITLNNYWKAHMRSIPGVFLPRAEKKEFRSIW